MSNAIYALLASLGIVGEDTVEPYFPRVRDRDDIEVFRCRRSGVIFLATTDHVSLEYYEKREQGAEGRNQSQLDGARRVAVKAAGGTVVAPKLDDALRRERDFGHYLRGRRWLDVGTGAARLLDRLAPFCTRAIGVEPNDLLRADAVTRGHMVVRSLAEVPENERFDVVTLFHVFEHIADPIGALARVRELLAPGGLLIVEIPHARDFLLETADCDSFRQFTLWSEHLVLHTRTSLTAVLRAGGFSSVIVMGYQRYPLANHIYWLRHGKPGGHEKWKFLDDARLHESWSALLQTIDQTDTLVALAHT